MVTQEVKITRATARTLAEWVEFYERKTGDKAELREGFRLFYMPERGFAQMKIDVEGKILLIDQACGDARFWRDVGEIIAIQNGLNCIGTLCTRSIKPYIRSFGWEIEKTFAFVNPEKSPGKVDIRYLCRDGIGRAVVATESGTDGRGNVNYLVTHYLIKGLEPDLKAIDGAQEVSLEGGDKDV